MKLYLHIGHPKCGSSSIQQALHENRLALLAAGIGVADDKLALMKASSRVKFPIGLFRELASHIPADSKDEIATDEERAHLDDLFRALAKKASSQGLSAVVVSAENMARPSTLRLVSVAKAYFDCHVIYYIRRHDDWMVSSWAQWQFKTGISLGEFGRQLITTRKRIFRDTIETAIECFGMDKLRVRALFSKCLEGGDLVTDFWSAIGVPADKMQPVGPKNVSFSNELAAVLKESPYLFDGLHDNSLTQFIDDYHRSPVSRLRKDPLGPERRREILDHFLPELQWIKRTFFAGMDMDGWLAVQKPAPDAAEPAEDVGLKGLAEMLNLNLAMLKDLREDVDKIKKAMGIR